MRHSVRVLLLGPNRWPTDTRAPEAGLKILRIERRDNEQQVMMDDSQGKSPYLYGILERGVYEQEWLDLGDLKDPIREVLTGDLGVAQKSA